MSIPFTAPRFDANKMGEEFRNLPASEQRKAIEDLYGKSKDTFEETEDILDLLLEDFEGHLQTLPNHKKVSYLKALEKCHDYVTDRDFRLQFVRADYYDAKKAALRFVKYWDAKEFVFGDKAFHRLTLNDLDADDLATLYNKAYLPLPKRDAAGRAIMFSCRQKFVFQNRKNVLRLLFYLVNGILEQDVSVQRTGFVTIVFEDGNFDLQKYDRKLDNLMLQYSNQVWPVRFVGFHYCFDSRMQELVLPFGLYMLGQSLRARFRLHPGSKKSARIQEFEEYGISADCLPIMMNGNLDFNVEEFLSNQRFLESRKSTSG